MRIFVITILLILNTLVLVKCSTLQQPEINNTMNQEILQITSNNFENGGMIPVKHATKNGEGKNISPQISWPTLPIAKSYAVLLDDKHPIANGWVHWLIVNIPSSTISIPEGASRTVQMAEVGMELTTSWNKTGYDGPQPPIGSGSHEYVITLYALDTEQLDLTPENTKQDFLRAAEDHIITQKRLSGYFERN